MPCFKPLKAWRSTRFLESGKRGITFSTLDAKLDAPLDLPCGQCIGCRLEKSRQWAIRCVHEGQMHEESCFLTLTYSPENLPPGGSLRPADLQLFMKRLRKHIAPTKVRYFQCGEYGSQLGRPHHHAILFGFNFPDRRKVTPTLWRSPLLEELWPHGHSSIGEATFESAAYVARYVVKKVTGDAAESHYQGKVKEYVTMSRRPGIGATWYTRYKSDVYPHDQVIIRGGIRCKPPRFYDGRLEIENPKLLRALKLSRKEKGESNKDNNPYRLLVRGSVAAAKLKNSARRALEE